MYGLSGELTLHRVVLSALWTMHGVVELRVVSIDLKGVLTFAAMEVVSHGGKFIRGLLTWVVGWVRSGWMKYFVTLKTLDELKSEDWKTSLDRKYMRSYLFTGTRLERENAVGYYDACHLLGRKVEVVDTDFESDNPRVRVKLGDRVSWISIYIVKGHVTHKSFEASRVRAKFNDERFVWTPQFKRFEIGCQDWKAHEAIAAAKWILKQTGYVVKKK